MPRGVKKVWEAMIPRLEVVTTQLIPSVWSCLELTAELVNYIFRLLTVSVIVSLLPPWNENWGTEKLVEDVE